MNPLYLTYHVSFGKEADMKNNAPKSLILKKYGNNCYSHPDAGTLRPSEIVNILKKNVKIQVKDQKGLRKLTLDEVVLGISNFLKENKEDINYKKLIQVL